MKKARVAYIMSRFPHLPETFILREMNELAELGWDIALYPIVNQEQTVVHPMSEKWLLRAKRSPFFSKEMLYANLRFLLKNPWRYGRIWLKAVFENISSPKFLSRTLLVLPKAAYFAEQMEAEGVQHIHAHYASHPALMAWVIHQLTGIPYTVTVHAHDIFVKLNMLKTKLGEASAIVAISEFNIAYLRQFVGDAVADKATVIHCGIDFSAYAAPNEMLAATSSDLQLITIGSLQPYKGQSYLIEACAHLREAGVPFHCRIIGEGEERPRLTALIETLGLADQITLMGAKTQDEVMALLPTANCYVQPSIITPQGKMEGIPVSIMEAFAAGLPVVATELSGVPELVQPGKTGYLVPEKDAKALANALQHVYENPSEAAALAEAGNAVVANSFAIGDNARRLSMLFDRLIGKGNGRYLHNESLLPDVDLGISQHHS